MPRQTKSPETRLGVGRDTKAVDVTLSFRNRSDMKISSRLPIASLFFKHWAPDDREVGVVIAKAEFRRHEDGVMRAEAAPELVLEDVFDGDPAWTPLRTEQDIAPLKRGTDLTIDAVARAPGDKPQRDWPVTVAIADILHYQFQVRGPAAWVKRRRHWERATPEAVTEVPIAYSVAYGGTFEGAVHDNNPAGTGLITPERLQQDADIPIPQIGLLAEFMTDAPSSDMQVHGLGPIAKAWLPRRALAGTFDEDWLARRHPRMPSDFEPQFWNAAPGPLQIKQGLRGDEVIQIAGVSFAMPALAVALPKVWCGLQFTGDETAEQPMILDTVHLDVRAHDPTAHTITMIWRAQLDRPARFTQCEIVSGRLES